MTLVWILSYLAMAVGYASAIMVHEVTLLNGNGSRTRSFAIADFDHDDDMDIAAINSGINNIGLFLGYGNNSFTNQTIYPTSIRPLSAAISHFNNDTNLDIVVANSNDSNFSVLLGFLQIK